MPNKQSPDKYQRKKDFRKLLNRISEILYEQDYMEINYGFNPDEYSAEAGRILLRLRDTESTNDIEGILAEIFSYPGIDIEQDKRDLAKTARAIGEAWETFKNAREEFGLTQSDPNTVGKAPLQQKPKTIAQLVDETAHRQVTQEEFNAAREYERSLIPTDAVIPKQGQRFRCQRDLEATVMMVFSQAGSATQKCIVTAGTEVIVDELFETRPIVISCKPLDAENLASHFVPQADRDNPKYSHYYLQFSTVDFLNYFEPCDN